MTPEALLRHLIDATDALANRYRQLFGRLSDAEIARKAGVHRSVVGGMRRRMGIAAVGRGV